MDIVYRLRSTRATMLGTEDEQHYADCHEAAGEIERLRGLLCSCKNAMIVSTPNTDWTAMIDAIVNVIAPNA